MMSRINALLLSGLVPLILAGCGGGGGSAAGPTTAGIDGTGVRAPVAVVSSGVITGFGSVIVNGVRYDTSNAAFTVDGQNGSQDDLAVGDVVVVRGELDDDNSTEGTATSVDFDDVTEGPISAIDTAAGTITVLGQTVRVNADTSFDDSIQPPSLAGLTVGDIVEVSGLVGSDGSIAATRLELKPLTTEFELTGIATNVDVATSTMDINGQVVDYSAAVLSDFDNGTIDEGDLVEVKAGTTLGGNGELLATRVEFKGNDVNGDDGDQIEIEGLISRFVDIDDFDVAGFPVTTDGNVTIEGGVAADLGLDIKVEVEGTLRNGTLVATKIEIRLTSDIRATARIDSVNAAAGSFVVLGITVNADDRTRYEDKSAASLESFSLDDLRVGDYVEVRGVESPAGSGAILASLLERDDAETTVELRGIVETGSVAQPSFSILGVTITTDGATEFENASEVAITPAEFYANAEGSLVEVEGLEVGDQAIAADKVEFED